MRRAALTMAAALAATAWAHEHEASAEGFYAHARELLEQRQTEKAVGFLIYALDHHPLDLELNLLYLDVLAEEGLEIMAVASYGEKLEHFGEKAVLLYAAGRVAEDEEESARYYKRALEADDKFAPAWVALGELALRRGACEEAASCAEKALAAAGDEKRAYALRGEICLVNGDVDGAIRELERALEGDPYAPAAHAALAEAYFARGDAAAARDEYRAALAGCDDRGEYYFGLARAQEALGETGAARLAYEAAAGRYGNVAAAAEARKAAGRLALAAGDLVTAAEHVGWAAAFLPDDAELHGYLGKLYMSVERPREAAAEFARAVELAPEEGAYWHLLGRCRGAAGELEAAEEALERAADLLPETEAAAAREELEAVRARRRETGI
jgi:tetratricopeptide (TPR) repeat protein